MTRHAATTRDCYECDDDILEAAPENPVRFLHPDNDDFVWQGMIDAIEDLDRLEAYRQAEKRHISRDYSKDKVKVHKHIDAREHELTGEPTGTLPIPRAIVPMADFEPVADAAAPIATDAAPVAATDGGVTTDDAPSEPEGSDDEPTADDVHPDAKGIDAGQVLKLERGDTTEYIFPATPACETPYLMRTFDGDDERTDAPIGMDFDEVLARLDGSPDPLPIDSVDVRPPTDAATTGGDA